MAIEPTADQTYCDVGNHPACTGHTQGETDPETCMCDCHREPFASEREAEEAQRTEYEPTQARYFTAGELAAVLAGLPADTPIFVPGMEEGVNYATNLARTNVELFENIKDYEGQHAEEPAPMFRHRDPRAFADHGYKLTGGHIQEA